MRVQVTVNFNILPGQPQPLTADPTNVTFPDEVVGVAVEPTKVSTISGGTPPYSQPVVDDASPAPLPPGLSASLDGDGNVVITGTPQAAGQGTVVLNIDDSAAATTTTTQQPQSNLRSIK